MSKAREISELGDVVTVDGSNVGIGTSSPVRLLSIDGGSTSNGRIHFTNTATGSGTSNGFFIGQDSADGKVSLWNLENDYMRFATNNTERMRIDASGNVGIGTTPSTANGSHLQFDSGYAVSKYGFLRNSYYDGSTYRAVYTGGATLIQGGDNLLFYTAPSVTAGSSQTFTERMRLDASGNLTLATTIANATLSVANNGGSYTSYFTGSASSGYNMVLRAATTPATAIRFLNSSGTDIGSIDTTATATSYTTSSDYRLKEDVQPMVGASDRVLALNPVNFAWKADGTRVDGFLAHEAQAVVPEAVSGTKDAMRTEEYEVTPAVEATYDEDGNELTPYVPAVMGTREVPDYQGIDQSKLVPLLTAALQEALNEIAALKDRVAALETV